MKFLLLVFGFFGFASSANILYLSNVPSPSHFIWCKSLLLSLHERGHNLTILSADIEDSKPSLTYLHLDKVYSSLYNDTEELNFFEFNDMNIFELFKMYTDTSKKTCKGSIDSKGFEQLMNYPDNFKFDLVLIDFTMDNCLFVVFSKFGNINTIGLSAFNAPGQFGANLLYPAFIPTHDLLYTSKMSFSERLYSTISHLIEHYVRSVIIDDMDAIVHEKYPNIPSLSSYSNNYKMYLINNDQITDYKQPFFPNQKNVGGAQIKKPKELPDDLRRYAESATNGLVLFSLGTNVRSDALGNERVERILSALGRLKKYKFLWKFETKELLPVELPVNVKIQAWVPQNDILAHHNTRLFISHCGLLSTQESLWYGVPVLGLPVFADQPANGLRLENLGVSKTLSIMDVDENELYETIKELIENPAYRQTAKTISRALRDRPMTALEEATYWTEWVLRNPQIDLEGGAADLNLFQRHSLDIYTSVLFTVLAVLYIFFKIMIFSFKFLFSSRTTSERIGKHKKIN